MSEIFDVEKLDGKTCSVARRMCWSGSWMTPVVRVIIPRIYLRKERDEHYTTIHSFVPSSIEEDLLSTPTFLRCKNSVNWGHVRGENEPGVPNSTTFPGRSKCTNASLMASAIPTPQIAMRLCPHAWPIPGRAGGGFSTMNDEK
jgi:hypothetical protein